MVVNGKWEKKKWKKGGNGRLWEGEIRFFFVSLKYFDLFNKEIKNLKCFKYEFEMLWFDVLVIFKKLDCVFSEI